MTQLQEILKLSLPERIHLVQTIWDSIVVDSENDFELSDEHKRILDERLEAHKKNPNDVLSWEEVKYRVENRK